MMGEWISVNDRLPDDEQEVVAVVVSYYGGIAKKKTTACTVFRKERGFAFFGINDYFVTHWMPLPPPPEA